MAKREEPILCKGHKSSYLNCSGNKMQSEYFNSWSPFSNGKVPYCKQCCERMIQYYLKKNGSMKSALWYTLMKLDIPFIKEIYEKLNDLANNGTKNGVKRAITLASYITELQKSTTKKNIWCDFSATNVDISDIDSKIESRDVKQRELDQWEIDWGKQDLVNDYRFLQNLFNTYTKDVEFVNPIQTDKYRDLCLDRLYTRQINENRYKGTENLDTIQKRIDRTMATLKLDEFESNKPKNISEQSLFEKIRLCNENHVKDLYNDPKLHFDYNKIVKYNKEMSLRTLGNMLLGHRDFNININDIEEYKID